MTAIVIGVALVSQVIWWAYHQLESVEHQIELEQQLNLSKQHFVAHELLVADDGRSPGTSPGFVKAHGAQAA